MSYDKIYRKAMEADDMKCRMCGVCCSAVSINSPQMTKAAGERCKHLKDNKCSIWGDEKNQPSVCRTIKPTPDLCHPDKNARDHYKALQSLERATTPKK